MNRQARIESAVTQSLAPMHLEVLDESHHHAVPAGAESHFKLLVISERFAGQGLIARHRMLHGLLREEFHQGLHALALHTWTPQEWFDRGGAAPESPPCLGGSKAS